MSEEKTPVKVAFAKLAILDRLSSIHPLRRSPTLSWRFDIYGGGFEISLREIEMQDDPEQVLDLIDERLYVLKKRFCEKIDQISEAVRVASQSETTEPPRQSIPPQDKAEE